MAVSIEQAAANALATYLGTALGSSVSVEARWPDPEKELPAKAVTILTAGPSEAIWAQPREISSTPVLDVHGAPTNIRLYRWHIYDVVQPLQLDCWALYDVTRDELRKAVHDALNAGTQADRWPVGPGLVLALGDGWSGSADYIFDHWTILENANTAGETEYRAICRGEARVALYIDAPTPKLARLILKQTLNDVVRPDDVTDF